jgi:hypothetical protein
MNKAEAMSISIGVLGGIDTLMTATIVSVPVWVTFIAWASFFALGGGKDGLFRSIASNITGIAIASLTLLTIGFTSEHPFIAAICVGVGSAAMVQASKVPLLSITPGIVFGFASTVGTTAVIGNPIDTAGLGNPALIAASAMVIGGIFGFISEVIGDLLTKESQPA